MGNNVKHACIIITHLQQLQCLLNQSSFQHVVTYHLDSLKMGALLNFLRRNDNKHTAPVELGVSDAIATMTGEQFMSFMRKAARGEYFVYKGCWLVRPIDAYNMRQAALDSHTYVTRDQNGDVTSVSITDQVCNQVNNQLRVDIYYYGQPMLETWLSHVKAALDFIQSNSSNEQQTTNLMLHFPVSLDFESVESLLRPVIGDKYHFPSSRVACILVEAKTARSAVAKL